MDTIRPIQRTIVDIELNTKSNRQTVKCPVIFKLLHADVDRHNEEILHVYVETEVLPVSGYKIDYTYRDFFFVRTDDTFYIEKDMKYVCTVVENDNTVKHLYVG